MSGGSWDYLYRRVEEMGATLSTSDDPLRAAFGRHLIAVADAMHDIEWVDSCDYGQGGDREAILKVIQRADVGAAAVEQARRLVKSLQGALDAIAPEAEKPQEER